MPLDEWSAILGPLIVSSGVGGDINMDSLYAAVRGADPKISRRGFGAIIQELSIGDNSLVTLKAERGASKIRSPLGRVVLRSLLS